MKLAIRDISEKACDSDPLGGKVNALRLVAGGEDKEECHDMLLWLFVTRPRERDLTELAR